MTITDRTAKARAALYFAQTVTTDKDGRVTKVRVPGSEAKRYTVILRRNGHLSTECLLETGNGEIACRGNQRTVCYHALAALLVAAETKDNRVSFCATQAEATLLARTGGEVHEVKSHQGGQSVYMVVKSDSLIQTIKAIAFAPALVAQSDSEARTQPRYNPAQVVKERALPPCPCGQVEVQSQPLTACPPPAASESDCATMFIPYRHARPN